MSDLLFVYGLLRRKANHKMGKFLYENAEFISEATFQGRLYLIDYYPGVIPSQNPVCKVKGDVFILHDPNILHKLDHFEGIGDDREGRDEYFRAVQKVELNSGIEKSAWVYLYNWQVKPENEIKSGDFLAHQKIT